MTDEMRKKTCIAILIALVIGVVGVSAYLIVGSISGGRSPRRGGGTLSVIGSAQSQPRRQPTAPLATIPWKRDSDEYQAAAVTPSLLPWVRTTNDAVAVAVTVAETPWRRDDQLASRDRRAFTEAVTSSRFGEGTAHSAGQSDVADLPWPRQLDIAEGGANAVDQAGASLPWSRSAEAGSVAAPAGSTASLPWDTKPQTVRSIYLDTAELPWRR
jgi:hypothetical protein